MLVAVTTAACQSPSAPPREVITVTRPVGTWRGTGNRTIGVVSDSGRFRITWQARNADPSRDGTFRLTVHSAVSGRPIQVVADHRGDGSGAADVADDPRSYNLIVESADVEWSFTVDEFVVGYAPSP